MTYSARLLATAFSATIVAASAFAAPNVLGSWKGHVSLDRSKLHLPPNLTAQQKAMVEQQLGTVRNIVLLLDLKSNKTYTLKVTGAPQQPKGDQGDNGSWTQSGNTITFKSAKNKTEKAQTIKIAPNGKSMTLIAPGGQGKVVFTR